MTALMKLSYSNQATRMQKATKFSMASPFLKRVITIMPLFFIPPPPPPPHFFLWLTHWSLQLSVTYFVFFYHPGLRIGTAIMGNELVTYFLDKHFGWVGGGEEWKQNPIMHSTEQTCTETWLWTHMHEYAWMHMCMHPYTLMDIHRLLCSYETCEFLFLLQSWRQTKLACTILLKSRKIADGFG